MKISRTFALGPLLLTAACTLPVFGQDAIKQLERELDLAMDSAEAADRTGYLGMTVDAMGPEGKSVYVVSVIPGGPADRGGLKAKDQLVSINGVSIGNLDDMDRAVQRPAGSKLEFKVRRDGVPQRFEVILARRPAAGELPPPVDELPPPAARTGRGPAIPAGRPSLGISVADISELTRRRFGVVVDSGAVISQIREGTAAAKAGLPLGGVIVSVNGKRIGSADDIVELIRAFRPGEEIEITYFEGDRIGRKKVRLGQSVAAVATPPPPPTRESLGESRRDPPLRLGRRRVGDRPILEALERTLDIVLPPSSAAGADDDLPPLPPPPPSGESPADRPAMEIERPAPPVPRPATSDAPGGAATPPAVKSPPRTEENELEELRRQMRLLQQQMEKLQRRIDALEAKRKESDR
jgi:hypothetical protein